MPSRRPAPDAGGASGSTATQPYALACWRALPRKTDLAALSEEHFTRLVQVYNNTHDTTRKCLGYQTPAEIFRNHMLHFKCESTSRMRPMFGLLYAVVLAVFFFGIASSVAASEVLLPFESADDLLPPDSAGSRQALHVGEDAAVSISSISHAIRVSAETSAAPEVKQHAKHFRFFIIPVSFGVQGIDGTKCKALQLGLTLRAHGLQTKEVYLKDVFPKVDLKQGNIKMKAEFGVTSNLQFVAPLSVSASGLLAVDGQARVKYDYVPMFQHISGIHDQRRALWRFEKVGQHFPVGQTKVYALLALGKIAFAEDEKMPKVYLDFELRAEFDGWFKNDMTLNETIAVRFP